MASQQNKQQFCIGDACEVYSNSRQKWYRGEVIEENKTKRGLELTVRYRIQTKYAQKRLCVNSQFIRQIDITNDVNSVHCVCGEKMLWMFAKNCYPNQPKDDEKVIEALKDTQGQAIEKKHAIKETTNKSSVSCDGCSYTFDNNEQLFHCPKATSDVHNYGSDLCYKCAMHEAGDDTIQNIDIDDAELKNNDSIARELGNEPFAEGSARYAYLGLWQVGKKKGTRCVIKRYKDKHLVFSDGYEGDIKCSKLAAELVKKWNELNLIDKKYEVIVPIIARKSGKLWEVETDILVLLALLGLDVTDMAKHMLDQSAEAGDNAIRSGELVLIEDYLKGDFMKWNSNSGWFLEKEFDVSVQAFCHWTYHYSNGAYLFCDAQGVKRATKYILTDPAILSNTEKGGVYGVTDCGRQLLLIWFRKHKCNDFCDKNWKKPSQMELDSVEQYIRKSVTKATTFNVTKMIKSNKLGSQSISLMTELKQSSLNSLESVSLKTELDNNDEKQAFNVNKYKNKQWLRYDKYLSVQNGERIIICSKVIRLKTFSSQRRVLLLSSYEKLYLFDPSKGFDGMHEFSKKQVKKVELKKNDKYKMILHLSKNKIWITLIDVVDNENDAKTWKRLIDINMRCN